MCKDHKASISFSMNQRRKARLFRGKGSRGGRLKASTPSAKPSSAQCTPEHARRPWYSNWNIKNFKELYACLFNLLVLALSNRELLGCAGGLA